MILTLIIVFYGYIWPTIIWAYFVFIFQIPFVLSVSFAVPFGFFLGFNLQRIMFVLAMDEVKNGKLDALRNDAQSIGKN